MKTKKIRLTEEKLNSLVIECVENILSEAKVIAGKETSRTADERGWFYDDNDTLNNIPEFIYNWANRLEKNLNKAL